MRRQISGAGTLVAAGIIIITKEILRYIDESGIFCQMGDDEYNVLEG